MNTTTSPARNSLSLGFADVTLSGPPNLAIGDEVTALIRIRVTGTTEREAFSVSDRHTLTTTANVLEVLRIDDVAVSKPEPTIEVVAAPTLSRWDRARRPILLGAVVIWAVLMLTALAGCGRTSTPLPAATTPAATTATVNASHIATCAALKAKTEDSTRTAVAREAAQAEYDTRCADVKHTDAP